MDIIPLLLTSLTPLAASILMLVIFKDDYKNRGD